MLSLLSTAVKVCLPKCDVGNIKDSGTMDTKLNVPLSICKMSTADVDVRWLSYIERFVKYYPGRSYVYRKSLLRRLV